MRYFKYHWNESRGDEYDNWGTSDWYFEVDIVWDVKRQIEVYANGISLTYDDLHWGDQYGMLSDKPFVSDDLPETILWLAEHEITQSEFLAVWNSVRPLNLSRA